MPAPLIVVAGTGTDIGKTHTSVALLIRWGESACVCGVKPIETGVAPGDEGADTRRLRLASTFHVKHEGATFVPPISPHLAARAAGVALDPGRIADSIQRLRESADGVLVELAGGLFSPLGNRYANADLALALAPTAIVLVAPNRIGVLHDVAAATRAAEACGLHITGIVLAAPPTPDASTGSNAGEIGVVTDVPLLAALPRAPAEDIAKLAQTGSALAALLR